MNRQFSEVLADLQEMSRVFYTAREGGWDHERLDRVVEEMLRALSPLCGPYPTPAELAQLTLEVMEPGEFLGDYRYRLVEAIKALPEPLQDKIGTEVARAADAGAGHELVRLEQAWEFGPVIANAILAEAMVMILKTSFLLRGVVNSVGVKRAGHRILPRVMDLLPYAQGLVTEGAAVLHPMQGTASEMDLEAWLGKTCSTVQILQMLIAAGMIPDRWQDQIEQLVREANSKVTDDLYGALLELNAQFKLKK